MIDTRTETVTTVTKRRSFKTPAHWNEVMKVTTMVMHEVNAAKGRPPEATPYDDEMWFEPGPGDDEVSICYQISRVEDTGS